MKKKQKPANPIKAACLAKWDEMRKLGINITAWSRDNGFNRDVVMSVLRGNCACLHGQAHAVAVTLGIKEGAIVKPGTYHPRVKPVDGASLSRGASA
jgi:gp16 family phage-associated protein